MSVRFSQLNDIEVGVRCVICHNLTFTVSFTLSFTLSLLCFILLDRKTFKDRPAFVLGKTTTQSNSFMIYFTFSLFYREVLVRLFCLCECLDSNLTFMNITNHITKYHQLIKYHNITWNHRVRMLNLLMMSEVCFWLKDIRYYLPICCHIRNVETPLY